ncbi:MAG TPA: sugar transferase [Cytophagaceae bacterium]
MTNALTSEKSKIAYIESDPVKIKNFTSKCEDDFEIYVFENGFKFYDWINKNHRCVDAVVSAGKFNSPNGSPLLSMLRASEALLEVPFVFIHEKIDNRVRKELLRQGVSEIFDPDFDSRDFCFRLKYLIYCSKNSKRCGDGVCWQPVYKVPVLKRAFDIVFSLVAIILLLPVFLIIAILIRLESKGPVFYSSKRVGTGYKIFDFYKFRSMTIGADAKLKDISHLNLYSKGKEKQKAEGICETCKLNNSPCQSVLYLDGNAVCEKIYLENKKAESGTFVKISNDPRITRIGKFIRNTSIDELPQLFNVLKGDMSIVGNRPLPLYEAEKITTDQFTLRFMAPAGITGLWQVTKRGRKGPMSEEERIQLDNDYAKNYSFWRDIEIIVKTVPALLQKENV